jgi:hypothetical protein
VVQKTNVASRSLRRRLSAFHHNFARLPNGSGRERPARLFGLVVLPGIMMLMMSSPFCRSQDTASPPVADKAGGDSTQQQEQAGSSVKSQGHEKMFGIMPAYGVVGAGKQPPPLTSGQKFKLAVQYLNPYTFVFVAAEAGINQAINSPREYGQGAEGYGKRYGAGFADGLTNGIFVTGVYPSLLHQDPRYYRLGDGSLFQRTEYAVSRILLTRQDSGHRAFNISEIMGNFTSSAIAVSYYPASQRDFSDLAERAGVQLGFDAGFNVLKEFYPDIERKLFHKKRKQ